MFLLDTSAWLAHLFGEPGVEEVTLLFDDPVNEVAICVLSLAEVYGRLKALRTEDRWPQVWMTYSKLFSAPLPVDETVTHHAIVLRKAATKRLPTIDALIAATAVQNRAILVHRDPHFDALPVEQLQQIKLPEK
jgi:predicted nucleic acid-binding protein